MAHPRRMKRHGSLAPLVLACLASLATSAGSADASDRLPVLVPFPDCGSTVLLPVRINGAGPYLFILDSGANSVVLDNRLADSLGLASVGAGAGTGAGAGKVSYRRYPRESVEFDVAGVRFRSDHAISLDLSNQPGILGYPVPVNLGS